MRRLHKHTFVLSVILMISLCSSAFAKALDTDTDAKSKEVLQKTCNFYKGLKSFTSVITDPKDSAKRRILLAAQKPNLLSLTCNDAEMGNAVCDGKSLYLDTPVGNVYQIGKAPDKISGIFKISDFATATLALNLFVYSLLTDDPYSDMVNGDSRFEYVGKEKVGTLDCHHLMEIPKKTAVDTKPTPELKITHEYLPHHIWIDTNEAKPWLRREARTVVMTCTFKGKATSNRIEITYDYGAPVANPSISKDKFSFIASQGATEVASIAKSPEHNNAMVKQAEAAKAKFDKVNKSGAKSK